jgi:hypothetical protein
MIKLTLKYKSWFTLFKSSFIAFILENITSNLFIHIYQISHFEFHFSLKIDIFLIWFQNQYQHNAFSHLPFSKADR